MSRRVTESLFREEPEPEPPPDTSAPLAERMRPRSLEEFVGQRHLVGEGRVLRRVIEGGGLLPSLILWGGPGTGKTTLARLLASRSGARFVALSAVFSGVKEVRAAIAEARDEKRRGKRTTLFIDEIHRFNKSQQDALLPAVEDGTVTLIGATTENPSFEVIGALLSRSRVLTLEPLGEEDVVALLRRALEDEERGLATLKPAVSGRAAVAHRAGVGRRRARRADRARSRRSRRPSRTRRARAASREETVVEALGRARYAYDKGGEEHYNLASALIKVLRNSDADAAPLLAGAAHRGRRRPRLHRAPPLHPRLRGRRAGRPAGDGAGRRRRADHAAHRAARSALPALAGDRLPGARAQVERGQARLLGRRPMTPRRRRASPCRCTCATPSRRS